MNKTLCFLKKSDSKCKHCNVAQSDLDVDGMPAEYCSDKCRLEAGLSGKTVLCTECKKFPRVDGSNYCAQKRCRNCYKCKVC